MSYTVIQISRTSLLCIALLLVVIASSCTEKKEHQEQSQNKAERQTDTQVAALDYPKDEKAALAVDCFLGDFRKARREKKAGVATLSVWQPYIDYNRTIVQRLEGKTADAWNKTMLDGVYQLRVEYDEVWTWENDEYLTAAEKNRYAGHLDLTKLYWKGDKVQALTLEKEYIGNPMTDEPLVTPSHKIVKIYDRDQIFEKLREHN